METNGTAGAGAPLRVHRGTEVPPRRQIALRLEAGIRDGGYAAGTRLPSVRSLGARLGVHRETVAAAYRELVRQGLARAIPGSGVYVSSREPALTHTLGNGDGALAMRLASLSAAIRLRRLLLLSDERALGEIVGKELDSALGGVKRRVEPPSPTPTPALHFGWLPIRVTCSAFQPTATTDAESIEAGGPALRPIQLRAGLSEFDLKVLSMQRYPAVVGVLSHSPVVRSMVREAVRGGAGPEVGVLGAAPGEHSSMRRLRAHATILAWDAGTASGAPRLPGRRHLLLRLVPERFVSELLDLLGEDDSNVGSRRRREGTDRVRAGIVERS